MPLIILTGFPSSGKTHRAKQIQTYLTERISSLPPTHPSSQLRVHLVSDHTLGISRSVYNLESKEKNERSNNASEKDARATIYAAVKRVLSSKDIVILDGFNYIKGWRYQLFCEAKAARTPHCVVHVGTPSGQARKLNEARRAAAHSCNSGGIVDSVPAAGDVENVGGEEEAYEPENWENLVFRYEEPNAFTRWDSPLFTVLWEDSQPPNEGIWDVLVGSEEKGKVVVRPNAATVLKVAKGEDYLFLLDKETKSVVDRILEWNKDHSGEGGEVSIETADKHLSLEVPSNVGLPMLQRHRRQYLAMMRKDSVSVDRIVESFVGYLNDAFQGA